MREDDLSGLLAGLSGEKGEAFDWREYYHAIRERLWIVLLCLALGGIGATIYMSRQETRYVARSVLFFEQEQDRVLNNVKGVREEQIVSLDMINTIVDLLRSYPFAQRVSERTKLNEDPRFLATLSEEQKRGLTPAAAAGKLAASVNAEYRKNTRLIDLLVTSPDPSLAVSLANAYADEYLRYLVEKRSEANKAAHQYLLEEGKRLRDKMRISDEAMQSFRERERAASLENLQDSAQKQLTETVAQIAELEQKSYQLETDLKVARANPDNMDELLQLTSVNKEPKVAKYTDAIADQERSILQINQRYRAKHPVYIAAHTQLSSLIAERKALLRDVVSLLENGKNHLEAQYAELKKSKEEQETRLLAVTGKSVEYNGLKRELETDRAMYESVLARIKEIDLTKGLTDSPVRLHERASGAIPKGASAVKIYGSGLFLAFAAGIGLSLGLHFLDHSIKTVEHAEQITKLPVLAAVPQKKGGKVGKSSGGQDLDSISDRDGVIAESFRSLRASVAMLGDAEIRRSFLFTSAVPSEGKTFCSANFAVSLCQQGYRTLLIDADLRKPRVSTMFFGEHRKPGLSDVLSQQVSFEEATIASDIENLSILTAGSRSPNPAELLASVKMRELIKQALLSYDRLVIDTAPTIAVSDALLIAPHVSTTCLVLRSFSTQKTSALRVVRALSDINCRPSGIILNFLPSGPGGYYNYYYSGRYSDTYGGKGVYGAT